MHEKENAGMQEVLLYDAQLTRSDRHPILVIDMPMDAKDANQPRANSQVEQEEQKPQIRPEQIVENFVRQLEERPLTDWSDHQLQDMLQQLRTASRTVDGERQKELKDILAQRQQQVAEEMQRKNIPENVEEKEGQLDGQLAEKWAEAVGDKLEIKREEGAKVRVDRKGNTDVLTLPKKLTLADIVQAAKILRLVEGTNPQNATEGKIQSFAKQLKDATFFLAKQVNADGQPVFDDGVLTYVYDYAEQLRVLTSKEGVMQKKTAEEIRSDAQKAELLPEYFTNDTDAQRSLQNPDKKRQVQQDYENHLLLFLLGKQNKGTTKVSDEGTLKQSFYQRFLQREKDKGRVADEGQFDKWLIGNKESILRRLARFVNKGRIYSNENTQSSLEEETQKRAEQSVFEAISQRGKEKRKELTIKALEGKPEILQQAQEVLHIKPDNLRVSSLLDKVREIKQRGSPLEKQLEEINEMVLLAYGLKAEPKDANYSAADALIKGEFGCSIQALIMSDLLQETFADDLIIMADTTVSGNTEDELSGHIRLVVIDKKTLQEGRGPEAFFVDTHTGDKSGFQRVTDITHITDVEFVQKALNAYRLSPNDFNISVQLHKNPTGNETADMKLSAYENNHTLTNVNLGIESAIWNNMAATAEPLKEDPEIHLQEETTAHFQARKIRMVERALALNPTNAIAWAQLANLNAKENTIRYNAFLQKAQAINPEVQIPKGATFTIDKYTPSTTLTSGNPEVQRIQEEINDILSGISPDATLNDLEANELEAIFRDVENTRRNPSILADAAAVDDLSVISRDVQLSYAGARKELGYFTQFSTLTAEDKRQILRDPETWLENQFDSVYTQVRPGQFLDSPQLQILQNNYNDATRAVAGKFGDADPERVKKFTAMFTQRLYAAVGRSTLDARNFKDIGGVIGKMGGVDAVFEAMKLDDGKVELMYRLLATRLDGERLAQGGPERRLKPEVIYFIQEDVINESLASGVRVSGGPKDYQKAYEEGAGDYAVVYRNILKGITDPKTLRQRDADYIEVTFGNYVREYKSDHNGAEPGEQEKIKLHETAEKKVAMERTRQNITRSVRLAYDLLTITARDAVIAARGKPSPEALERYRSDPTGVNAYNLETFLLGKFGLFNHEEEEFLKFVKKEIAKNDLLYKKHKSEKEVNSMGNEELEEIGTEVLKDLFAVPDFYSSGWRIEGMLEAMRDRIGNKGKNLGLFMQLKFGSDYWGSGLKGEDFRKATWEKIARYYPEEIVKLFRERFGGGTTTDSNRNKIEEPRDEGFIQLMMNDVFKPSEPFVKDRESYRSEAEYRFDMFKKNYDSALAALRGRHIDKYEQVNIQNLSQEDKDFVNKYLNDSSAADNLQKAFKLMTEFALDGEGVAERYAEGRVTSLHTSRVIAKLMQDTRFIDIYTRTLRIDDIPLSLLQEAEAYMKRHAPVGALLGSQIGNDSLIRSWGDTNNAQEAAQLMTKFFIDGPIGDKGFEEKIKTSEEFAKKVETYNGTDAEAEMNRALMGSLLLSAEQNVVLDYLGINHLPFNKPISKSQEIFGPAAKSLTRGEIKVLFYQLREKMVKGGKISKEEADEIVHQLEKRLGIRKADMAKMQIVAMIILFLIASVSVGIDVVDAKGMVSGK